jgi:Caspase domain
VRISMQSGDFDTYLGLITPTGDTIENDDFDGNTRMSVIDVPLQESGRYRILATSYGTGETGDYELSLAAGSTILPAARDLQSAGRIFGIFAGMADYPGEDNDLPFTDEDAERTRDALIDGAGMDRANAITLLNEAATRENLSAAIDELSGRMGPDDRFVFFYSGHGDQVSRETPEAADPDGLDETIELYDGAISDNEFHDLLTRIPARQSLIVLDSCFSGGFAKDLISVPGRMGLFSSEEDVTSQVAAKFRAGGYLSVFFEEALSGGFADFDESGDLTAIELSQYLHERFRNDVKSFGEDRFVSTSGSMMGYQHLVVDRGSISPYDVLFAR